MELMQKYVKDSEMVGVDNIGRWRVDSNAFEFLSAISTTESIDSLKQVGVPWHYTFVFVGHEINILLVTACS